MDSQRDQTLRTQRARILRQFIDLFAAIPARAGHANAFDHTLIGKCAMEHTKGPRRRQIRDLYQGQSEAQIGMIRPIAVHHILVAQAREWTLFDALVGRLLDQKDQQTLDQGHHIILDHKRHLQVQLCKFWLAIRALVLVAETACNLEVAIQPTDHQQLLELLGRLRQGIELTGIKAARHKIIARAFGSALHQDRSLDLQKFALIQVVAYNFDHAMTQHDIVAHLRTAQVEIAIFQTQGFIDLNRLAIDRKWRRARGIEDLDLLGNHLDLTSAQVRIFGSRQATYNGTSHLQHIFRAHFRGDAVRLW